ncbi:LacI family DNA-binding transcriptional regulator [Cellulomonas aerilata]|uniref:LacI family transcriptional regulator n=1 Tax=Cellulomonas aerilata TaxID=515326 RepID=A0A512DHN1_9CELL|nr:LacI family DNA-binding transcriptional regulator [Cellulomonas aerilata]GEO35710.1 LacI family transcriptional regulator [Cellulomonas aerilata]
MASIKDVAALAQVSTATASRALSGRGPVSPDARERVLRASAQLKFVPSANAAGLASGRSRNIGVIVPGVDRWFFAKVVRGISEELLDRGYDLSLYTTGGSHDHQEKVLEDYLLRQRLDAVVPVALELTRRERAHLLSIGRPVVGVGGAMAGVCTVGIDQEAAGALATGHLIGLGHRSIAHITAGTDPNRDFALTGTRRSGFEHAMARAGLEVRPSWLVVSDFTLNDAYARSKLLLASPERPTAVFAASDEMAAGTILAARDLGLRVPADLSVVGVDGHELGEVFGLTTVQQFPERQGARAAALLMQQLGPEGAVGDPHHETVPTEFVVRSSTAAPVRPGPA